MRRGERGLEAAIARRDHALELQADAARAPGSDDTPFAELPAYALAARLDALLGVDPTAEVAVRIDLASATAMSELTRALEQRGADAAAAVTLASGGGAWLGTHVEALEQVARAAASDRTVELDAWLEGIHGWHALREQLLEEPPLRERRDLVRSWIEQPLPGATHREHPDAELDPDLQPLVDRARQLRALRERAARQRGLLLAAVRAVTWTLADRLAADGTLDHADEAFDRSLDELFALARGGSSGTAARTPAHDRAPDALDPAPTTTGVLQGMAASVGTAHGPVVVLDDPADAGDVTGAILVCRSTDPGWMPHLMRCAGLVTERGGPLSHGAIVARELGIPAVVAVRGARTAARSCATATIDGTAGTVAFDGTP
jgi:phosphohistidine swiveling domain-containing protein